MSHHLPTHVECLPGGSASDPNVVANNKAAQMRAAYVRYVCHTASPGLTGKEALLEELTAAATAMENRAEREPENADQHLETASKIKNAAKEGDIEAAAAAAVAAGLTP